MVLRATFSSLGHKIKGATDSQPITPFHSYRICELLLLVKAGLFHLKVEARVVGIHELFAIVFTNN